MKRAVWIQQLTVLILTIGLASPAWAQDGRLRAADPQAQINLRSSPDPDSSPLGYGLVGDRVEILEQVPGSDDYTWVRVRFYQSGAIGWIRGDLVQPIEAATGSGAGSGTESGVESATARYQAGYSAGYQLGERDGRNARRYNAGYQPEKFIQAGSGSLDTEYDRGFRAGFFAGFDAGYNATANTTDPTHSIPANATLLTFQTDRNAVRIFSRSGQTYMNLFDKQAGRTWLNGVLVEREPAGNGIYYRYQGEVTVVVFQGNDGTRSLDINGSLERGS
ncbi:MAG: SH3 domain-containing protein [Elainella sp. Prado103]|jgi:hypothetical protein|nr:SH3 domain-containing protein [Elainella sp. Prado103]